MTDYTRSPLESLLGNLRDALGELAPDALASRTRPVLESFFEQFQLVPKREFDAHMATLKRLEDTVAELEARESELKEQIEAVASRLAAIPPRSIEEDRLERRLRSAERFYEELQARHRQVLLAEAHSIPDFRVFSWATPPREPVGREGQLQLVLVVFLISLAVAVLDAIMLYWLDRRLEDSSGRV